MNIDYSFLSHTILFKNVPQNDIPQMLSCLSAKLQAFEKGTTIYHAGDYISSLGIIIKGNISLESDDIWGNKNMIDTLRPGQVFAETYATLPEQPLMLNVIALEDSEVLFLNAQKILTTCTRTCTHHQQLIRNLFMVSVQKNLNLSHKIFHSSPKTIRGKLLSYLSYQSLVADSYDFTIPFNRQQLADYLGVDRSALSNEISKLQKEGLLMSHKNSFSISKNFTI